MLKKNIAFNIMVLDAKNYISFLPILLSILMYLKFTIIITHKFYKLIKFYCKIPGKIYKSGKLNLK